MAQRTKPEEVDTGCLWRSILGSIAACAAHEDVVALPTGQHAESGVILHGLLDPQWYSDTQIVAILRTSIERDQDIIEPCSTVLLM